MDLPALPELDPEPRIEPMNLIPHRAERERPPSPEVPEGLGVGAVEEREPSGDDGADNADEDGRGSHDTRRGKSYEYSSSDSELNTVDCNHGMMDAVWATVDSRAATSCLPLEMCKQMNLNLAIAKTSDLPYTNASGEPVKVHGICSPSSVTLGARGGASISGVGGCG